MHLLQSGVNLIYIRDFLGHADIKTTEIYAKANPEMKRNALERAYAELAPKIDKDWTDDNDIMEWLKSF
jgi:site-specific recombinase XerD